MKRICFILSLTVVSSVVSAAVMPDAFQCKHAGEVSFAIEKKLKSTEGVKEVEKLKALDELYDEIKIKCAKAGVDPDAVDDTKDYSSHLTDSKILDVYFE